MSIKLIVTDLDGTLLHTDKTVSEKTLQTLQKCQNHGIPIMIATARFWIGAERYINLLHPDYEITADGTMVHHNNTMVCNSSFDLDTTNLLIHLIQNADSKAEIVTAIDKTVYWNSLHISESDRLYKATYFDYSRPLSEPAQKIAAVLPNKETANSIAKQCTCKLISYRDENLYTFIPSDAGKLHMIQLLTEQLHISLEEVAAFGDDTNDIDMLKGCGIGIAVANAVPEVQKIADKITLSNDEDGVAKFIEAYIL